MRELLDDLKIPGGKGVCIPNVSSKISEISYFFNFSGNFLLHFKLATNVVLKSLY